MPIWVRKGVAIEWNLEGQVRGFEMIEETGLAFRDTETAGKRWKVGSLWLFRARWAVGLAMEWE